MIRQVSAVVFSCLLAATLAGTAQADSKSGPAKFTGARNESVKVALGNKLKLEVELKLIEVGTQAAMSVSGKVKNTTGARMFYSYNVAFLDKDKNVIGCQNFALPVEPMKDGQVGTFIQLPRDEIAKIAFYSIALHESDRPIGSR